MIGANTNLVSIGAVQEITGELHRFGGNASVLQLLEAQRLNVLPIFVNGGPEFGSAEQNQNLAIAHVQRERELLEKNVGPSYELSSFRELPAQKTR